MTLDPNVVLVALLIVVGIGLVSGVVASEIMVRGSGASVIGAGAAEEIARMNARPVLADDEHFVFA